MNRGAISVGEDQGPVIVGLVGLVVGINLETLIADIDSALGTVRVAAGERGSHVLKTDTVFIKRLRNEFGPYRRQRTTADNDFADALDLRQFLRQHGRCRVI